MKLIQYRDPHVARNEYLFFWVSKTNSMCSDIFDTKEDAIKWMEQVLERAKLAEVGSIQMHPGDPESLLSS